MSPSVKLYAISFVSHFILNCKALDRLSIAPVSPIYQLGLGNLGLPFRMTSPRTLTSSFSEEHPEFEARQGLTDTLPLINDAPVEDLRRLVEKEPERKQVNCLHPKLTFHLY